MIPAKMNEGGEPVQLYLYDLSRGMAKTLSPQLVGKTIEGIWHTSVVIYGVEYYFGQGIQQSLPVSVFFSWW